MLFQIIQYGYSTKQAKYLAFQEIHCSYAIQVEVALYSGETIFRHCKFVIPIEIKFQFLQVNEYLNPCTS